MRNITEDHINKHYPINIPEAVVLHVDLGTFLGTRFWITGHASASYHWYIRRYEDEIIEYVPPHKGAWHAGVVHKPTPEARKIFGYDNPNKQSIGICYEGQEVNGDGELATDRQVKLCVALLKEKRLTHLPIFAHQEITSYKPNSVLDFKRRVIEELAGEADHKCSLNTFPTKELIKEVLTRYRVY